MLKCERPPPDRLLAAPGQNHRGEMRDTGTRIALRYIV